MFGTVLVLVGVAITALAAALLIVVAVGRSRGWDSRRVRLMAVTWGFRLWLALLLLCMGLFLIVDAPIETTGGGSLVLILSGGVAAALIVRALRGPSVEPGLLDATGALPDRSLDYLVWWTLGIVVLGLVVGVVGLLLRSR